MQLEEDFGGLRLLMFLHLLLQKIQFLQFPLLFLQFQLQLRFLLFLFPFLLRLQPLLPVQLFQFKFHPQFLFRLRLKFQSY